MKMFNSSIVLWYAVVASSIELTIPHTAPMT